MNKDFSENKLLSFDENKQVRILLELALFIEKSKCAISSSHFLKLSKYHSFLKNSPSEFVQKINKEFAKIKQIDYQFQVYLMNLERFVGMSSKEYDFIVERNDNKDEKKVFDLICICDSVRSAHNIGSFFRNAECFGASQIILTGLSPTPENPQVKKTSMGCDELIKWSFHQSAIEIVKKLKQDGYFILGIETTNNAVELNKFESSSKKIACLFGHEQFGLSLELIQACDQIANIQLYGNKNSLNVAISQGIALKILTDKLASSV